MPTDPNFGEQLLDRMSEVALRFCVLHGVRAARLQSTGDIDIAVDRPVRGLVRPLARSFQDLGGLVCAWHYDSVSWSIFIVGNKPGQWAQLDLTFDPRGLGTYGMKTGPLVTAASHDRWPVANEMDAGLYRLSKALRKGRVSEAQMLLANPSWGTNRPREILGDGKQAQRVMQVIQTSNPGVYRVPRRPLLRNAPRIVGRVVQPCGLRARMTELPAASQTAQRLLEDLRATLPAGHSRIKRYLDLPLLSRALRPSLITVERGLRWVPVHGDLESKSRSAALIEFSKRYTD